jgi:hypothetical protein
MKFTLLLSLALCFIVSCKESNYSIEVLSEKSIRGPLGGATNYSLGEFRLINTTKDKKLKYTIKKKTRICDMFIKIDCDPNQLVYEEITNSILCEKDYEEEILFKELYPGEEIKFDKKYNYFPSIDNYDLINPNETNCMDMHFMLVENMEKFWEENGYDYPYLYYIFTNTSILEYEVVGSIELEE